MGSYSHGVTQTDYRLYSTEWEFPHVFFGMVVQWQEHPPDKGKIGGSSPPHPIKQVKCEKVIGIGNPRVLVRVQFSQFFRFCYWEIA